jgi:hypothetical protein
MLQTQEVCSFLQFKKCFHSVGIPKHQTLTFSLIKQIHEATCRCNVFSVKSIAYHVENKLPGCIQSEYSWCHSVGIKDTSKIVQKVTMKEVHIFRNYNTILFMYPEYFRVFNACLYVYMIKLQMFCVWSFCHTIAVTTLIQFVPNTGACSLEHSQHLFVMCCYKSFTITVSGGTTFCLWYIPIRNHHIALEQECWGHAPLCFERNGISYWYLSCGSAFANRKFATSSFKLRDVLKKQTCFGYIDNSMMCIKFWTCLFILY